jgi:thioredoxin 1
MELIKFGATWCAPCKNLDEIIKNVLNVKTSVIYISYDSDSNPEEFIKNNIISVPTVIIKNNEKEVERFVGVLSHQKIINLIEKHEQS